LVKVRWEGKMRFTATRDEGQSLGMDASTNFGGEGQDFTPVELILAGLGGCTGMDIIWIMNRQRQEVAGLEVNVSGTKRKDEPHYYETINAHYVVRGPRIDESALKKAIELSEEKYCTVRANLRPEVKVTTSYSIETSSGNSPPR
jgi:putative redox protein